jgi:hypothetical protein
VSETEKQQLLDYFNECFKAYHKAIQLKDRSKMDINFGAMQAIRHMLVILNERIAGINA